jgi:hypothetical protein
MNTFFMFYQHSICSICVGRSLGVRRQFAICSMCGKRSTKPLVVNIALQEIIIENERTTGDVKGNQSARPSRITFTNEKFAEMLHLPQEGFDSSSRVLSDETHNTSVMRASMNPTRVLSDPTTHHNAEDDYLRHVSPPRAASHSPSRLSPNNRQHHHNKNEHVQFTYDEEDNEAHLYSGTRRPVSPPSTMMGEQRRSKSDRVARGRTSSSSPVNNNKSPTPSPPRNASNSPGRARSSLSQPRGSFSISPERPDSPTYRAPSPPPSSISQSKSPETMLDGRYYGEGVELLKMLGNTTN